MFGYKKKTEEFMKNAIYDLSMNNEFIDLKIKELEEKIKVLKNVIIENTETIKSLKEYFNYWNFK